MSIKREELLRYLENRMTESERNAFERKIQTDLFYRDAMEGFEESGTDNLRKDLENLDRRLSKRAGKNRMSPQSRKVLYRIAAAVAALIAVGSVLYTVIYRNPEIFQRQIADTEISAPEEKKSAEKQEKQEGITVVEPEAAVEGIPEVAPGDDAKGKTEEPSAGAGEKTPGVTEQEAPVETGSGPIITDEPAEEESTGESMAEVRDEPVEQSAASGQPAAARETTENLLVEVTLEESPEAEQETIPEMEMPPVSEQERMARAKSTVPERTVAAQPAALQEAVSRMVSGKVVSSADNQPLPGAVLLLKGTNLGTMADQQGQFSLEIPEDQTDVLTAMYIGMRSADVNIGDRSELNIALQPDNISLDEVVVVGEGTRRPLSQTGAVSAIGVTEDSGTGAYQEAEPSTGYPEFRSYIEENLQFPEEETELERAVVILNFEIPLDGIPRNITVLKSPGIQFSREAIRLIEEGPRWRPAMMNGQALVSAKRVRIVFKR